MKIRELKIRTLVTAVALPLMLLFSGGVGAADGTVTLNWYDTANPNSGGAGPFTAYQVTGPVVVGVDGTFTTFCLEGLDASETISLRTPYDYQLSTTVIDRGVDDGVGVALNYDTAYLYETFRNGESGGIGFDTGFLYDDVGNLMALQDAIYAVEYTSHTAGAGLATLLYNEAISSGWTAAQNYGNVRVMNLGIGTGDNPWNKQDQLAIVPIPAAAWLFGTGLIGLAVIRRRKTA